jgi:hypothetical protein
MKRAVIITLLVFSQFSGIVYAIDEKPVIKEPIPPVNIDKTANVEEIDAVPAPVTQVNSPNETKEAETDAIQAKPGRPEIPKKREMDTNYDGRVDRIEVYDSEGRVVRLDVDTDFDGIFEEWMIFENGKPKIKGVDRNKDGRTDTWIEY